MNNWFGIGGSRSAAQERFPYRCPSMRQENGNCLLLNALYFHGPVNLSQNLDFFLAGTM
jgi:hypothetical protein